MFFFLGIFVMGVVFPANNITMHNNKIDFSSIFDLKLLLYGCDLDVRR